MQNELLDLIDQIEMQQAIAEMEVCNALLNSYSKSCMILENASDTTDMSSFEIFQESCEVYQEGEKLDKVKSSGSEALKTAKGKKSENIIIRILKFIPRFIMAFVRNLRSSKKSMEKKIDEIEKVSEELKEVIDEDGDVLVLDRPGTSKREESTDKPKDTTKAQDEPSFVLKDGGTQWDDRTVRKSRRESFKAQKTLSLPMKDRRSEDMLYLRYANGDIRINFPWDTFDLVTKLNKKSLDYAEIVVPVEDALNVLVDTFSEDRLDSSSGKRDSSQRRHRSKVVESVRTRDLSGKITLIQNQIDEANRYLTKLKKYISENNGRIKNTDVRDVMLSEVLKAYRNATYWMGYTDKLLSTTATRIKETTEHLPTLKSGSAHHPHPWSEEDYYLATYLNPEDAERITRCVNMLQHTVDVANKQFGYIVGRCNDGLDKVYAAVIFTARKAGINVKQSWAGERESGKDAIIPDQQRGGRFEGDKSNGNADRAYKRIIR